MNIVLCIKNLKLQSFCVILWYIYVQIWCTDIDDKKDNLEKNEAYLHMSLPQRYQLHHAFASYLYLNIHDQALQGKKNPT